MTIEVFDTLPEIFGDGVRCLEVSVVKSGFLQHEEPRLDQVEPGRIRRSPVKLYIGWGRSPQVSSSFVRTEVIPDKIDLAVDSEARQHDVLQKCKHDLARLVWTGKSDGLSGVRGEGGQQLNGLGLMIAIRAARRPSPPTPATAWDSSQRTHFVDTNHDAVRRRIAIELYDLVFFTSNSGS